ncbi:hypothetical protein DFJ77DRAFT_436432 [Powellomyces hirtus]|nr:hypothetical protein DFJ77DRAFT_436432 [Powellomyces hirtus]
MLTTALRISARQGLRIGRFTAVKSSIAPILPSRGLKTLGAARQQALAEQEVELASPELFPAPPILPRTARKYGDGVEYEAMDYAFVYIMRNWAEYDWLSIVELYRELLNGREITTSICMRMVAEIDEEYKKRDAPPVVNDFSNSRKAWTAQDDAEFWDMWRRNLPYEKIARVLKRTEYAVKNRYKQHTTNCTEQMERNGRLDDPTRDWLRARPDEQDLWKIVDDSEIVDEMILMITHLLHQDKDLKLMLRPIPPNVQKMIDERLGLD